MTGQSWGHEQPHHHHQQQHPHQHQHADERDDLAMENGPDEDGPNEGVMGEVMRELLRESVEGIEPVDPIPLDASEGA